MNIQEIKAKVIRRLRKQKESAWFQQAKEFALQYPRGTALAAIGFLVMSGIGICSLCKIDNAKSYSSPYCYNFPNTGIGTSYSGASGYNSYPGSYSGNSYYTGYSTPYNTTPSMPGNDLLGFARQEAAWQQRELQNSIYEMAAEQTRETERRIMEKRIADGWYTPKF